MNKIKKDSNSIYICDGKKCCRYNEAMKSCLESLVENTEVTNSLQLKTMKCQGMCKKAPVVYLSYCDKYKKEVTVKKAQKIYQKYLNKAE